MFNLESKFQKNIHNQEKDFQIPHNQVVVCPWVIRNGFQNISENGYLPANANPYWYGFFQKIFTGNQVITATWENSTYLTKVANAYKFQYNFKVGKYHAGAVVVGSAEYSTEIEPMTGNEDFLAMKNSSEVIIRFENWVPTEEDMYKLYTIPDLYGGKWYYISSVKVLNDLNSKLENADDIIFNDTSIPACEITFTSLVDKLQVSGKAVEQYVQYAGIGEPYAIPYVVEYNANAGTTNNWIEPTKRISYIPYQPQSANYLQFELQGANAFSGLEVEGRKLAYEVVGQDTQGQNIYAWTSTPWKRLLAHNVVANQVNELNRTSLPSRNFYYFPNETLSFITSKTFQEDNKTREDALAMNQSAGKLSMSKYENWSNLGEGLHMSNPATADGTHYDYNNSNWKPTSWTGQDYTQNTQGNFYAVSDLTIKQTDSFVDILNKNSFIYETQPVIPLGFVSSKPYHISAIPIVGKIVSKFWGDMTINPNTTQRKPINIGYFIDCDVAGMLANIYSGQSQGNIWCPLSALVGDETKASKYLGTTALNTTVCVALTDKISENGTAYDTIYFGQKKKEDGTTDILSGGDTYYYGRENQVTQPKNDNDVFVIDSITIYGLHKGKIKLTAFNTLSNPIWTSTIQSKANWTNSIRDWATTITCGGWSEDYCNWDISDFPWPARPDKVIGQEIYINHSNSEKLDQHTEQRTTGVGIYSLGTYKNGFSYLYAYYSKVGIKNTRPQLSTTVTTSYTDLNVGISTKEQFRWYFKEMVLFVSGKIQAEELPPLETKETEISIPITGADSYTGTYIVGQMGDQVTGVSYPVLAKNDSDTAKKEMHQALFNYGGKAVAVNSTTGGFSTSITYEITLNDNNFTIVIKENDYANGWGTYEEEGQNYGFGYMVENMVQNRPTQTLLFIKGNVLSFDVNVPKLRLVESENQLELFGGSKELIGAVNTAGQDINTWEGRYLLQETPVLIYNNPTGVTINNGKVSWSGLAEGVYNFYVYVTNGSKYKYEQVKLTILATQTPTLEIDNPSRFAQAEIGYWLWGSTLSVKNGGVLIEDFPLDKVTVTCLTTLPQSHTTEITKQMYQKRPNIGIRYIWGARDFPLDPISFRLTVDVNGTILTQDFSITHFA